MSKKEKKQNQAQQNVVQIQKCLEEQCSSRAKRANFCEEHYLWFKEGLITKEGKRVKDFDKKMQQYKNRAA